VPSTADGALEVTVQRWLTDLGQPIQKGQDLVELTTEKIALYIPAPVDGTVAEIHVAAGGRARVGQVVGVVAGR
jgi:pyruvate dehydrogenase E2 component (dihydrolipoamide acetyltransferase)